LLRRTPTWGTLRSSGPVAAAVECEEAERWVLSWGSHATVVRPRALRNNYLLPVPEQKYRGARVT
jgi:hypothetical protein